MQQHLHNTASKTNTKPTTNLDDAVRKNSSRSVPSMKKQLRWTFSIFHPGLFKMTFLYLFHLADTVVAAWPPSHQSMWRWEGSLQTVLEALLGWRWPRMHSGCMTRENITGICSNSRQNKTSQHSVCAPIQKHAKFEKTYLEGRKQITKTQGIITTWAPGFS